ncbi:MAG: hypothetical protein JOY81_11645 [Alphaproteobacteria bacterium]|nr:hypothetical protein [Alphaproteobacteria bacterium]
MMSKSVNFVAPVALALALSGCNKSDREQMAYDFCPVPFAVQDTKTLTRFQNPASRDPRDISFRAEVGDLASSCKMGKNEMVLTLFLKVAVEAGPANPGGTTSVPYFVRVLGQGSGVLQGRDFTADFKLSAKNPRGMSQEELTLRLPFDKPADTANYRIGVGLKPTPEELDYARRAPATGAPR